MSFAPATPATDSPIVSKCLVTTIVDDVKVVAAGIGSFFEDAKLCIVLAKGRTMAFFDATTYSPIDTVNTSESILDMKFCHPNVEWNETDRVTSDNVLSAPTYRNLNPIVTVGYSGAVTLWKYDQKTSKILRVQLLKQEESSEPPYFLTTLRGSVVVANSHGMLNFWKSSNLGTRQFMDADMRKIRYAIMKDSNELILLARTMDRQTYIKCVDLNRKSIRYQQVISAMFTKIVPNFYDNLHLLVGANTIMLATLNSRNQMIPLANNSLDEKNVILVSGIKNSFDKKSILLAEKNGQIVLAEITKNADDDYSLHFIELGSEKSRPVVLSMLASDTFLIATKNGSSTIVKFQPESADLRYKRVTTFGSFEPIKDTVVIDSGFSTSLVTCNGGDNEDGFLRIFKHTMHFVAPLMIPTPNVTGLFNLKLQLNSPFDRGLAVSTEESTRFFLIYGVIKETRTTFSAEPTRLITNFPHHNCIVQVVPSKSLIFIPEPQTGIWRGVAEVASTIGNIVHVDHDVASGSIVYSSGNVVEAFSFSLGPHENIPTLWPQTNRQFMTEVTCLSYLSKDVINTFYNARQILVGLKDTREIQAVDAVTLDTIRTFDFPIISPFSMTSARDYFIVSDVSGTLVKCSGYENAAGHFEIRKTPTPQKMCDAFQTTITASTFPLVISKVNMEREYKRVGVGSIGAACSLELEQQGHYYALSNGEHVRIGRFNEAAQIIKVPGSPEKMAYLEDTKVLVVVTSMSQRDSPNPYNRSYHFIFMDVAFKFLKRFDLEYLEKFVGMSTGKFIGNETEYTAVLSRRQTTTGSFVNCVSLLKFVRVPTGSTCDRLCTMEIPEYASSVKFNDGFLFVIVAHSTYKLDFVNGQLECLAKIPTKTGEPMETINENKDLQSSSAQGASSGQIIHSEAKPCASVSNDLISVIDDGYYLDSYYLTEGLISDSLRIGNGMVPRGRYWLGAAATNIKTDRDLLQSEFLQNQQVFFTTDTGSVGMILQLNSGWSQIIEDITTAARTRAVTLGEVSGLQHEKNEQRSSTPCDYIDGDFFLSKMFSTSSRIREVIDSVGQDKRNKWNIEWRDDITTDVLIQKIVEFRESLLFFPR